MIATPSAATARVSAGRNFGISFANNLSQFPVCFLFVPRIEFSFPCNCLMYVIRKTTNNIRKKNGLNSAVFSVLSPNFFQKKDN